MIHKFFAVILFMSLGGLLRAQDSARPEREAIIQAGDFFSKAYVRGDVDAMMDCYSKTAVIIPGGADIIAQRDLIRKYWTLMPGRRVIRHKSIPREIIVNGNTAHDYGYYEGAVSRSGDEIVTFKGNYVIVWVKDEDKKWRMSVDMWSPAQAPRK